MQKTDIEWCDVTWNPVPGHDGYFTSADGRIMSMKRGSPYIMKQMSSKDNLFGVLQNGTEFRIPASDGPPLVSSRLI